MKKKSLCHVIVVFIVCLLSACGSEEALPPEEAFFLYYVSNSETKVVSREYVFTSTNAKERLEEMIGQLSKVPDKLEYIPPLAEGFSLRDYSCTGGVLVLNMDEKYLELSPALEVLTRAALVKSFTQLPEVSYVRITVEGEPLYDNLGKVVGIMSADQFIDNTGNEINTYEEIRLRLYFANEAGDKLVAVNRKVHYNTNVPMERLVIEQILAGVEVTDKGCYPTINPETKLMNVMVKDAICYVNLDKTFLAPVYNVMPQVTIYSLVNSLTELDNISKVQILIEGETNVLYRENILLSNFFEKDAGLIQNE